MTDIACTEQRISRRFQVAPAQQAALLRWQETDRPACVTDQSAAGLALHVAGVCDIQPDDVATLSWSSGFCRVRVAHRVAGEDGVRLGLLQLEDLYTAAELAMPSSIGSDLPSTRPHYHSSFGQYAAVLLAIVGVVGGLAWQVMPRSGDWNLHTSTTSSSKRTQTESSGLVTRHRGVATNTPRTSGSSRWIATGAKTLTSAVDDVAKAVTGATRISSTASRLVEQSAGRAVTAGRSAADLAESLVLALPRHMDALQLSRSQQRQVEAILRNAQVALKVTYGRGAELGTERMMSEVASIRRRAGEEVLAALSPEQAEKLRTLESGKRGPPAGQR